MTPRSCCQCICSFCSVRLFFAVLFYYFAVAFITCLCIVCRFAIGRVLRAVVHQRQQAPFTQTSIVDSSRPASNLAFALGSRDTVSKLTRSMTRTRSSSQIYLLKRNALPRMLYSAMMKCVTCLRMRS